MRTTYLKMACLLCLLSFAALAEQSPVAPVAEGKVAAPASQPASAKKPAHPRESLTAQAGDPTAPLVQAQMIYFYSEVVRNSSDSAAQLELQPVVPLPPGELLPIAQIIRPTVPFQDAPDGKSGLGDINLEHMFLPEPEDWGALGFGYTLTLPTADHRDLGAGKYQLGPATTIVYYGIKTGRWA